MHTAQVIHFEPKTTTPVLADLMGSFGERLDDVFAQMKIADDEIEAFCDLYPHSDEQIRKAFVQLRWILSTAIPEAVFIAHVRELLARVVEQNSLRPGTKAEALMMLSEGSLVAPLGPQSAALYVELFEEFFPDAFDERPATIHEPWEGASQELLGELRRRTAVDRSL